MKKRIRNIRQPYASTKDKTKENKAYDFKEALGKMTIMKKKNKYIKDEYLLDKVQAFKGKILKKERDTKAFQNHHYNNIQVVLWFGVHKGK